jgi:hypothetical protein
MSRSITAYAYLLALVSVAHLGVLGLSLSSGMSMTGAALATLTTLTTTPVFADADGAAAVRECEEGQPGSCVVDDDEGSVVVPDDVAGVAETTGGDDQVVVVDAAADAAAADADGDRLIGHEELALHTTTENRIWLSILGKVYDVTDGEDFYGALKGGYKFYAGRDASPCFATGNNTPEGANEKLEEWDTSKQLGVYEWSTFYENHEKYRYLGKLAGSRYYDEMGIETDLRRDIVERCSVAKKIADEEREKKKAERMAARLARKNKK